MEFLFLPRQYTIVDARCRFIVVVHRLASLISRAAKDTLEFAMVKCDKIDAVFTPPRYRVTYEYDGNNTRRCAMIYRTGWSQYLVKLLFNRRHYILVKMLS